MAIFFFVLGLGMKYHIQEGDFKNKRNLLLPTIAAVGGFIVPALLYYLRGSTFIQFLLQKEYLVMIEDPVQNCVVLYYDKLKPTHAALWKDSSENLESAWGTFGKIFKHEIWRVPFNYGPIEHVKYYYLPVETADSEKYFHEYCLTIANDREKEFLKSIG